MAARVPVDVGGRGNFNERSPQPGNSREIPGGNFHHAPRVDDRARVHFQNTSQMPHHVPVGGRPVHAPVINVGGHGPHLGGRVSVAPPVVHHHHTNPSAIHVRAAPSGRSWHSSSAGIAFWSTLAAITLLALIALPILLVCLL